MSCNEAWIGVGGTLGGVIIGFFLERFSKRGKLEFYNVRVVCSYSTYNENDEQVVLGNSKINEVRFYLEVYNSSEDKKIMRDIRLTGFINGKEYRLIVDNNSRNILSKEHQAFSFKTAYYNESGMFALIEFSILDLPTFTLTYKNEKNDTLSINVESVGVSEIKAHQ